MTAPLPDNYDVAVNVDGAEVYGLFHGALRRFASGGCLFLYPIHHRPHVV